MTDTKKRKSLYEFAPLNYCERCDGCKQIANDEEGTPWWHWALLPPPSNMAVVMGMVRPLPCPACGGTGVDPEESEQAAASAGQRTREQAAQKALDAFWSDSMLAQAAMPYGVFDHMWSNVANARIAISACLAHLDEIERHLPDAPRRGMLNDYYGGDEE